ncbi:MAG: aminoacyl-tRNA hydrolase [Weeping tea tree witches'-broom phytoplasma]|uniref:aminoacyl-tRNA hydrolase n=1 Tax=Candidatus Phytoplasma melaleucae TaxID=2982630 RepID=UPI00293AA104|nr:aminoacyl-tRNA hydrolase [Weeping tea tree witches'-broom phytoplasma]
MQKLIVGLGNPGEQFKFTPHNIGFMLIDYLLEEFQNNILSASEELLSLVYHLKIQNQSVILAKPQNYMNLSGFAIHRIMMNYQINIKDIFILIDDVYLEAGFFKLKITGGHGGHNGFKNIIDTLQTNQLKRLKIGVGRNIHIPLDKYVLRSFDKKLKEKILYNFPLFKQLLVNFVQDFSFENLINICHVKNTSV